MLATSETSPLALSYLITRGWKVVANRGFKRGTSPSANIALVATAAAAALGVATSHPAEAVSTNKYAHVNAAGGLVASNGVTGAVRLGVGQYEVTFASNVSTCAYVSTTDFNAAQLYTGTSTTAGDVYIETKNPGCGLQSGVPFHLSVLCANAYEPHCRSWIERARGRTIGGYERIPIRFGQVSDCDQSYDQHGRDDRYSRLDQHRCTVQS